MRLLLLHRRLRYRYQTRCNCCGNNAICARFQVPPQGTCQGFTVEGDREITICRGCLTAAADQARPPSKKRTVRA